MRAVQALTANSATGDGSAWARLSHRSVVEVRGGPLLRTPGARTWRYLAVFAAPAARRRGRPFAGVVLSPAWAIRLPVPPCPVYLSAFFQRACCVLRAVAADTITWCTVTAHAGGADRAHHHRRAYGCRSDRRPDLGRPPFVRHRRRADVGPQASAHCAGTATSLEYRAVLDREGAVGPRDIAVVGDEASFTEQLQRLARDRRHRRHCDPLRTADDRARTRGPRRPSRSVSAPRRVRFSIRRPWSPTTTAPWPRMAERFGLRVLEYATIPDPA